MHIFFSHFSLSWLNANFVARENARISMKMEGFWWGFGIVALGAAAIASGVVLTVSTAEDIGSSRNSCCYRWWCLTGAGAIAVIHPITNQLNGERA